MVPQEESLTVESQRVSTFADCTPKALIFKPSNSETLASTVETKTLGSAKNEAEAAKAIKPTKPDPRRQKKYIANFVLSSIHPPFAKKK